MPKLIPSVALVLAVGLARPVEAAPTQASAVPAAQSRSASAHHTRGHRHRASSHKTRIAALPAGPDTRVAGNSSPAPVPNEAVSPPDAPAPQAQIAPSSFQLHYPPVGDGYVTGSSSQAMDDREAAKATGVQMTVPLK